MLLWAVVGWCELVEAGAGLLVDVSVTERGGGGGVSGKGAVEET